jgi:hypothetical protein
VSPETSPPSESHEPISRWTRVFVWSFLAAFVICAVAGIEAFPFTGFRLFSHLRTPHDHTWAARLLDSSGRERSVHPGDLPGGQRGFILVARGMDSVSAEQRDADCRAWVAAVRSAGRDVAAFEVYAVDQPLLPRRGEHPALAPVLRLRYTCSGTPMRALPARGA